jgi:hypothetical protein
MRPPSTPPAPAAPAAETPQAGLSSARVAEWRSRVLTNAGGEHTSRSVAHILRANILARIPESARAGNGQCVSALAVSTACCWWLGGGRGVGCRGAFGRK